MLTAVGAATWPSGDQVWNGHIPASTPNPTMRNGKKTLWKVSDKTASSSSRMLKVPSPASTKIAIMAIHIRTLPATRYKVSFMAPYSLSRLKVAKVELLPQTPMRRYMGSTASS